MRFCYRNSKENEHTRNASQHQDEEECIGQTTEQKRVLQKCHGILWGIAWGSKHVVHLQESSSGLP